LIPTDLETTHQLRIIVNELQELKNKVRVIVAPIQNISVNLSYNVLLSNWQNQQI